jgi:hypothetical protein
LPYIDALSVVETSMKNFAIVIGFCLFLGGMAYYAIRFIVEYRKVKRQLDRIRASGRTKSEIRRMRREVGKRERRT